MMAINNAIYVTYVSIFNCNQNNLSTDKPIKSLQHSTTTILTKIINSFGF